MKVLFKNLGLIIFIIIGLVIIGMVFNAGRANNKEISRTTVSALSSDKVSQKVIDFINNNLLRGTNRASLVSAVEENGLYKIVFTLEGQENEIEVFASLDGELFFPEAIELIEIENEGSGDNKPVGQSGSTIGGFSVSNENVCMENGKPIIYFFGSEKCSFCRWEHPIMEEVALKFGNEISFHNNMDTDNDRDVFSEYSTGGIPTMVFGCRYYKTGAGQSNGEEGEARILTALICKLTNNKPDNVCDEVSDLINQI